MPEASSLTASSTPRPSAVGASRMSRTRTVSKINFSTLRSASVRRRSRTKMTASSQRRTLAARMEELLEVHPLSKTPHGATEVELVVS